jgi:hypothetical protein
MRRGVLHAEHHAAHQRRHRGVETRNLEAFDAAGLRRTAGIVEQAINAAEFLDRLTDQRAHLLLDGDIGLAEHTIGAEPFRQRLALPGAASGDDDPGAFGHENLRSAQPDAACRAGDNRDLAVQPSHVVLPVFAILAFGIFPDRRNNASYACFAAAADRAFFRRLALFWIRLPADCNVTHGEMDRRVSARLAGNIRTVAAFQHRICSLLPCPGDRGAVVSFPDPAGCVLHPLFSRGGFCHCVRRVSDRDCDGGHRGHARRDRQFQRRPG